MTRIDIIIPVYRGAAETRACIESVLSARVDVSAEIVVINDASPDAEVREYLAGLAKDSRITLVTNPTNLGFVASCNRGMELHAERDVVLLNSDTVVADGWLDRMAACAATDPMIASVTPFSNNATLCSYPRIAVSNELPAGLTAGELDTMFAAANSRRSVAIPTGVGFCMLMTRAAIDAVGTFDFEAFGRGYGEENDWCMRATGQGYSHQLCGDVFVYHQGEVSFGDDSLRGKMNAQSVIDRRYPGYREMISEHLEADPARMLRRRVDLVRLAKSSRPRVLFVTSNFAGNVDKYVRSIAEFTADSIEVLVLEPHGAQGLSLRWMRVTEEFNAFFEDRNQSDELLQLLRDIGISRVHLHHVHRLPLYVLDLYSELGVPLDVTLHDYFPVTPRYYLGAGGALEADGAATSASDWGLSETEWRQRMGSLLRSAKRVIAPSNDIAVRMKEYFPDVEFPVRGHPDVREQPATAPHKVLVVGALTVDKGLRLLEACARDARDRKLPLFFKLIGHTAEPIGRFLELPLVIGGTYREEDLEQLIALEKADAFLFPAQSPEAYSYHLSAALRTNLPIVASALGAFNERLAGNPRAQTIAWNSPANGWNDALMAAIDDQRQPQPGQFDDVEARRYAQAYANWYLQPISQAALPTPVPADYSPHTWQSPKTDPAHEDMSLRQLFERGVECGQVASRDALRIRTEMADERILSATHEIAHAGHSIETLHRELGTAQSNFEVLQSSLEEVKTERDAVQAAMDTMIASTSWRMTSPLRSAADWVRAKRAMFSKNTAK